MELKIELDTQNTGYATVVTDTIVGDLDCLIIDSVKPIRMVVTLAEYSDIVLYTTNNSQIQGQHYIPLLVQAIAENGEKVTFTQVKWCLNNKLRIEIEGGIQTQASVVIRYR